MTKGRMEGMWAKTTLPCVPVESLLSVMNLHGTGPQSGKGEPQSRLRSVSAITVLTFIEYILCARHCIKHFKALAHLILAKPYVIP